MRVFWICVYATASAVEFLALWVKEHAGNHIKGVKPPPDPPKP